MAKVKFVFVSATTDALYALDAAGNLWAYSQDAEWRLVEPPEEIPA